MAYKDEYEVARLHLRTVCAPRSKTASGPMRRSPTCSTRQRSRSSVASRRRLSPKRPARDVQGAAQGPTARGTKLDPFGRTEERRIERELITEYPELVDRVLARLSPDNAAEARAVLELADQIRGFDTVKLANVANYRTDVADALRAYEQ